MKICYIDEAGDGRRPVQRQADVPPVFVICGLVVDSSNLPAPTDGLLTAKARFRPPATGSRTPDGTSQVNLTRTFGMGSMQGS